MADDFVQSFKSLAPQEREKAVRKLVQAVGFSERQIVIATGSEKNDIVPALPLELILQVFSYLHLLDAWTLQLVGSRWRRVLSSEQFIRAALARWDAHDPSDSVRTIGMGSNDSIQSRIRHMRAIRLGRPFTVSTLHDTGTGLEGPQPPFDHRKLDFKGHRIAYISSAPGNGDTVVVRDLITGDASILHGEAREKILCVVLTETLVAFTTFEGCLYVAEFSHHLFLHQTSRITLPSAAVRSCGGHHGTIALTQHNNIHLTHILLYETATRRLRRLEVGAAYERLLGNASSLNSCSVLVDNNSRTVDVFALVYDNGTAPGSSDRNGTLQIRLLRASFEGEVFCTNSWASPIPPETPIRPEYFEMAPPQPTGYQGQFRIYFGKIRVHCGLHIPVKCHVLFDSNTANFLPRRPLGDTRLVVIDVKDAKLQQADPDFLRAEWKELAVGVRATTGPWNQCLALMNDTFLVSLETIYHQTLCSRIRIFCFDENVQMHGAKSTGFWNDN